MRVLPNGRVDLGHGYQFVPVDPKQCGGTRRVASVRKDSIDVGRVYETERGRVIVASTVRGYPKITRGQLGISRPALYQICRAAQIHFLIV